MSIELEHARLGIEILIHIMAEDKRIDLADITWRQPTPPSTEWEVAVKASTGRMAFQDFPIEELLGFQNDKQLKKQVTMKVASIIIHL